MAARLCLPSAVQQTWQPSVHATPFPTGVAAGHGGHLAVSPPRGMWAAWPAREDRIAWLTRVMISLPPIGSMPSGRGLARSQRIRRRPRREGEEWGGRVMGKRERGRHGCRHHRQRVRVRERLERLLAARTSAGGRGDPCWRRCRARWVTMHDGAASAGAA